MEDEKAKNDNKVEPKTSPVKKQEDKKTNIKKTKKIWITILVIVIAVVIFMSLITFYIFKILKEKNIKKELSRFNGCVLDTNENDHSYDSFDNNVLYENSYNIYDDYTEGENISFNGKITYINANLSYIVDTNLPTNNVDFSTAEVFINEQHNQFKVGSNIKVEGVRLIPKKSNMEIYTTAIKAKKLEEISYEDTISTQIKTINVGQRKTQKGYTVVLDRIEFLEDQTRVYISLENKGQYNFTIFDDYSVIKQNGNQYEAVFNARIH